MRLTGGCIYCLIAEPARECSRRPPARPATAPLPQPLQTLPLPLAPGAELEPRASASARPASAGRAGSASSLGDGATPCGSGPAAARRGTDVGPVPASVRPSWVCLSRPGAGRVREGGRHAGLEVAGRRRRWVTPAPQNSSCAV